MLLKPPVSWKLALPEPFANQNEHCTSCVNPRKLQVPRWRAVNLLAAFWGRDSPKLQTSWGAGGDNWKGPARATTQNAFQNNCHITASLMHPPAFLRG